MLTAHRAILGLALLLVMMDDSSGQSPPEPPRQNPGSTQQRTNTEHGDTDQAPPSIMKKLPAEDTQPKPSADEQKRPENRSDALALSDKIAVIASIVALLQFFALVATIFVLMRTAKRQLRAYVFVKDGRIDITPDGTGFVSRINFKNFGQTPAYQYSTWIGGGIFQIDDLPFPSKSKPLSERVNRSIVGPSAETPMVTGPTALSPANLQAIRNETMAIFIWGGVDYVDAFGKSRRFILKMRMTGNETQFGEGVRGWPLTPHPLGYEEN
jgi:hypothetical protein